MFGIYCRCRAMREFGRHLRRACGCLILATACRGAEDGLRAIPRIDYAPPVRLATLANEEIQESSGLAVSRRAANVWWTHNDSGDAARVFAFDEMGRNLGTCSVRGAAAVDWEDMASFERDGTSWLLLADVGDNLRRRGTCNLYVVAEPAPTDATVSVHQTVQIRYEGGPRNCEAVAVDPATQTVWLASKAALGAEMFAFPLPPRETSELLTARLVARVNIPLVTGMDVSPDGRRAVLLTYSTAYEFVRRDGENWETLWTREPRALEMPVRQQGESICYGKDGATLFLTSEKLPTPLWKIPPNATGTSP